VKFHKQRTLVTSPLEGSDAYRAAFRAGALREIPVTPTDRRRAVSGAWRTLSLAELRIVETNGGEPLEVSDISIVPRALVVDELTRHRSTPQIFVPVTGVFVAVAAESRPDDDDRPDPRTLVMVPVAPGEAFEVGTGTWHTLPYVFAHPVVGLSIMRRDKLDAYHDVRDLAAEGWIGCLSVSDPPSA
jgi:ureidoglycolate hydrolase